MRSGKQNALDGLREELKRQGVDYPYEAIADGPARSVVCPALLSRFRIASERGIPHRRACFTRNILEADVDCGGLMVKVFVNHWPAKPHPDRSA